MKNFRRWCVLFGMTPTPWACSLQHLQPAQPCTQKPTHLSLATTPTKTSNFSINKSTAFSVASPQSLPILIATKLGDHTINLGKTILTCRTFYICLIITTKKTTVPILNLWEPWRYCLLFTLNMGWVAPLHSSGIWPVLALIYIQAWLWLLEHFQGRSTAEPTHKSLKCFNLLVPKITFGSFSWK